jgi:soluble lytic murein transglycosylase-like protein
MRVRGRSPRLFQLLVGAGVAAPALLFTMVTGTRTAAPLAAAPAPVVAPPVIGQPVAAPPAAAPKPPAAEPPSVEQEAAELASHFSRKGFRVSDVLAKQIARAAAANGIDTDVAFGLVATESGFRNSATSSVGAVGLSQVMPRTAAWLEPGTTRSDLRNPSTNLQLGFRYLRHLIDRYDGDVKLGLTAYNRGPGSVDRILKRGGNPDNGYAGKVLGGARR